MNRKKIAGVERLHVVTPSSVFFFFFNECFVLNLELGLESA